VEGEMFQRPMKTGEGRMVLVIIALIVTFLAVGPSVEAAPILYGSTPEQGNSLLTHLLAIDGTVNYAVFQSSDFGTTGVYSDIGSLFTPGNACTGCSLDTTPGTFIYLFQITNSGTNSTAIASFSAGRASGATVTSWGYFAGTVFMEGDTPTPVSATNDLDSDMGFDGFAAGITKEPSQVSLTSSSLLVTWTGGIVNLGTSSIIVYTSPYGPNTFSSQINGAGAGASGPTPGADPVPEPSTILLMTFGLAGLAGFRRGFHRKGGRTMSGSKHPKRFFLVILLLAFGLLGVVARAEANPSIDYSEYTGTYFFPVYPGQNPSDTGVSGTVSFAVLPSAAFLDLVNSSDILNSPTFNPASVTVLDEYGNVQSTNPSAALDVYSNATVYLFQILNNGAGSATFNISSLDQSLNGKGVTSAGWLSGVLLTLGPTTETVTLEDNGVLKKGATPISLTSNSSLVDPESMDVTQGQQGVSGFASSAEIGANKMSSLLIYTAYNDPTMVMASLGNGGTFSYGYVPGPGEAYDQVPVPEPGTLLLLGSGLVGLAGLGWRRYRRQ
jgi:hypothetical protein